MTVAELLARISARELTEWMIVERITGPLGGHRGDVQAAIIAATVANSQRSKGRTAKPGDFMPKWDQTPQTPEEMWQAAVQANAAFGGAVISTTA